MLIDTYPYIADNTPVREYANEYHIHLTLEQYKTIYEAKHHQEWLIKTIRLDNYCFIEQFIRSITHAQDKNLEQRHPLRLGAHKAYTMNHQGVFRQIDKISPYAENDIPKKEFMSKPQSTTLINKDIQVPPFGAGERLLAGFLFDPKSTLVSKRLLNDIGTYTRPYEFTRLNDAQQKYQEMHKSQIFADNTALTKAAMDKEFHNEVMARLFWDVASSAVAIVDDSLEGRAVAQYYARSIQRALVGRYKKLQDLNKLDHFTNTMQTSAYFEDYSVPIIHYLPGTSKNYSPLSQAQIDEDTLEAYKRLHDDELLTVAIKNRQFAFLLLLNQNDSLLALGKIVNGYTIFIHLIRNAQFEIADELLHQAGYGRKAVDFLNQLYSRSIFKESFFDDALLSSCYRVKATHYIKFFLSHGANICVNDFYDRNPLHLACIYNRLDIVQQLLALPESHKIINLQDKYGMTPISSSVRTGSIDIFLQLFTKKSEINFLLPDKDGKTALMLAAEHGHSVIFNHLLDYFLSDPDKFNLREQIINSIPLAALNDHPEIILTAVTRDNYSDYHPHVKAAMRLALREGRINTFKAFSADFSELLDVKDSQWQEEAITSDNEQSINILINHGFNFDQHISNNETPLTLAIRLRKHNSVNKLLKLQVRLNLQNRTHKQSPLHYAAKTGQLDIVGKLFEKGAIININDKYRNTPLILAALNGQTNIVKYLIQKGGEINQSNRYGDTALIYAAQYGHLSVVEQLLTEKTTINLNLKNQNGFNAVMSAILNGHIHIARAIMQYGGNFDSIDAQKNGIPVEIIESLSKSPTESRTLVTENIVTIDLHQYARSKFNNPVCYQYDSKLLNQCQKYWLHSLQNHEMTVLSCISRDIYEKPYEDDKEHHIYDKSYGGNVAYHVNHGTLHALRQIAYQDYFLELIDRQGLPNLKPAVQSFSPEEKAIIRLAGFLHRAGRTNEKNHIHDPSYGPRSIVIFQHIAECLGFNPKLIQTASDCMNPLNKDINSDGFSGINAQHKQLKAEIVQCVIEVSHLTDLVRCWNPNKRSSLIEMMTTLLNPLFNHEIINSSILVEKALTIAAECCKATGCPVKMMIPCIDYDLEKCVTLSHKPKSALSTIRNTIQRQHHRMDSNTGTGNLLINMTSLREHARGFFKKTDDTQNEHLSDKSPSKPAML